MAKSDYKIMLTYSDLLQLVHSVHAFALQALDGDIAERAVRQYLPRRVVLTAYEIYLW
jgi:hypothetical protein